MRGDEGFEGRRATPYPAAGRRGDAATAEIGRRIVSGRLRPGDRLPTEAILCDELGLSRTTVREAIKRLHGKGLLDGGPRAGMRVLPTARWNQLDRDVLSWRIEAGRTQAGLDAALVDQLYAVRGCMEPEACRIAARRASPEERHRIVLLYDAIADEGSPAGHVDADVAFHLAIFAATGNPFFVTLGDAIRAALELAFRQSQGRHRMSAEELALHREVAHGIADARPEEAAGAMIRLLALSREALAP